MTVLTYPVSLYVPQRGKFYLQSNTRSFTSPLSGSTKTLETPGARWGASVTYDSLSETQTRLMIAFMVQLRGSSGRFYYGDPFHKTPAGVATGSPLVNGASQTGTTLITDGWTPSTTNILKAGDYFQLTSNELKMVTANVNSDGSGNATISFEPPLRSSPADNSALTVTSPMAIMRLQDDDQTAWDYGHSNVGSITLNMIESFT